jgi:hypothetical protein
MDYMESSIKNHSSLVDSRVEAFLTGAKMVQVDLRVPDSAIKLLPAPPTEEEGKIKEFDYHEDGRPKRVVERKMTAAERKSLCPDGSPMPIGTGTCNGREAFTPWTEEQDEQAAQRLEAAPVDEALMKALEEREAQRRQ